MNLGRFLSLGRALGAYAFAVAAGLAAAWAVREHIQQRTQAIEEQARVPMVPRVVAARDLPAGTTLDIALLAVRDVPEAWAASDSVPPESLGRVEGGVLSLPVKAGEPVLLHEVLKSSAEPVASQLGAGRRAFSLPLGEIRDLPSHVRPDDRIDLYVSFDHEGKALTVPLLQGGKVLSVDGDNGGPPSSITLEASADDALKVVAARQGGTLTALLRPAVDAGSRQDGAPRDLPGMLGLGRQESRRQGVSIVYGDRLDGGESGGETQEGAMP
jgi:pilus assembly protein CpaB